MPYVGIHCLKIIFQALIYIYILSAILDKKAIKTDFAVVPAELTSQFAALLFPLSSFAALTLVSLIQAPLF